MSLDRLRKELAAIGSTRRLAMLSAGPVLRGDLLSLISIVGIFSKRLDGNSRKILALALLDVAAEIDARSWN